jgi:ubiquinone biosynthesis protein
LPQLPRLVHHALSAPERHRNAQREELEQLMAAQRRQGRLLALIGTLLTAFVALELYRMLA